MSDTQGKHGGHPQANETKLRENLAKIGKKILVLSGKGGVGKSTVAANIAIELAGRGYKVGLLDIDFHGPSIPRLTSLAGQLTQGTETDLIPLQATENLRVMSIAFLIPDNSKAVIWRGPMKYSVIRKMLADTLWGELDYLVVDSPPGTGDEPLSIAQLVGNDAGAVVVTTPQKVAVEDVRRCIEFCKEVFLPVWGLVENMSGFVCPKCGEIANVFGSGGGEELAKECNIELLAKIPMDGNIADGADAGLSIADCSPTKPVRDAMDKIIDRLIAKTKKTETKSETEIKNMKIAIPTSNGMLSMHFGHCDNFVMLDVDVENKKIASTTTVDAPPHEPGLLPVWLKEQGANLIIAGGMGSRAQELFAQQGIEVITGASSAEPEKIVADWLSGSLTCGTNICDH